eukprot:gene4222-8400_t
MISTEVLIGAGTLIIALVVYTVLSKQNVQPTKKPKALLEKKMSYFTKGDVALHNQKSDAWIIVDNKVYDVTDYVDFHPGGDSILSNVGRDSSEGFHGPQHPVTAVDVLATYCIGILKD